MKKRDDRRSMTCVKWERVEGEKSDSRRLWGARRTARRRSLYIFWLLSVLLFHRLISHFRRREYSIEYIYIYPSASLVGITSPPFSPPPVWIPLKQGLLFKSLEVRLVICGLRGGGGRKWSLLDSLLSHTCACNFPWYLDSFHRAPLDDASPSHSTFARTGLKTKGLSLSLSLLFHSAILT